MAPRLDAPACELPITEAESPREIRRFPSANWDILRTIDRMSMWNTVPMRPLTSQRPFNAWGVAVLTYLLGMAVILGLGFVIGTLGFLLMSGMWITGAADGPYPGDLIVVVVAVAVGISVLSLAIQSRFIGRRGGARPVAAPVAALAASLLVGLAVTPVALPEAALVALQAVIEIVVLAKLIEPKR